MMSKKGLKMVNRCKFLNAILNICGQSGQPCAYMADPPSCPIYDEAVNRSYLDGYKAKTPTEIAQAESERVCMEVESLDDFVDRIEGELDGMGIKVAREEVEEAPDWF